MVERICVVCGSARTSPNNFVFLEGIKAALTTDCLWQDNWFAAPPVRGLKAFGRGYAGWGLSPLFSATRCQQPAGAALELAECRHQRERDVWRRPCESPRFYQSQGPHHAKRDRSLLRCCRKRRRSGVPIDGRTPTNSNDLGPSRWQPQREWA